jgi:hypothetical protein
MFGPWACRLVAPGLPLGPFRAKSGHFSEVISHRLGVGRSGSVPHRVLYGALLPRYRISGNLGISFEKRHPPRDKENPNP